MATNRHRRVLHPRSQQTDNVVFGNVQLPYPQLPDIDRLEYGEIAVNFAPGTESLSIRNHNGDDDEIVRFSSEKELNEMSEVISGALADLSTEIGSKADKNGDTSENFAVRNLNMPNITLYSTAPTFHINNGYTNTTLSFPYQQSGTIALLSDIPAPMTVDTDLDATSTNPVENQAITKHLEETELVTAEALNDLEERKLDKSDAESTFLTAESDPVFSASPAAGITANDIDKWNAAANIDSALDAESTNAVENQAVTNYIEEVERVTSAALNDLKMQITALTQEVAQLRASLNN